jgi:hypothetical protein
MVILLVAATVTVAIPVVLVPDSVSIQVAVRSAARCAVVAAVAEIAVVARLPT